MRQDAHEENVGCQKQLERGTRRSRFSDLLERLRKRAHIFLARDLGEAMNGFSSQQRPDFVDLFFLLIRELGYGRPAVRHKINQALRGEGAEGFSQRGAADPKLAAKHCFHELLTQCSDLLSWMARRNLRTAACMVVSLGSRGTLKMPSRSIMAHYLGLSGEGAHPR